MTMIIYKWLREAKTMKFSKQLRMIKFVATNYFQLIYKRWQKRIGNPAQLFIHFRQ